MRSLLLHLSLSNAGISRSPSSFCILPISTSPLVCVCLLHDRMQCCCSTVLMMVFSDSYFCLSLSFCCFSRSRDVAILCLMRRQFLMTPGRFCHAKGVAYYSLSPLLAPFSLSPPSACPKTDFLYVGQCDGKTSLCSCVLSLAKNKRDGSEEQEEGGL